MAYKRSRATTHMPLCFIVLFLLIGRYRCAEIEECSAVEGEKYTIKCAGNTTGETRSLYWNLNRQNGGELIKVYCSKNRCDNKQPEDFSVSLQEDGTTFKSLLTINNVTRDIDREQIECDVFDTLLTTDRPAIQTVKSCNLRVYHFPEYFNCSVYDTDNRGVVIKCTQENGLPGMKCQITQIVQEVEVAGVSVEPTKTETSVSPSNIKYEDRNALNSQQERYYASCTAEIYPDLPGRYKYHVEINSKSKDVTLALAFVYDTDYINLSMAAPGQASHSQHTTIKDTTISLHILIVIIVIIVAVVTLTVLVSVLLSLRRRHGYEDPFVCLRWPKCHSCHSSSNQDHSRRPSNNIYEDISSEESPEDIYAGENPEDNDNNTESPEDGLLDNSTDSTSWENSEYAYPSARKDHYENLQDYKNEEEDTYIIPITPRSTPGLDRRTDTDPATFYNARPKSGIPSADRYSRRNSESSPAPDSPGVNSREAEEETVPKTVATQNNPQSIDSGLSSMAFATVL